ncbi:MAG: kelch repeat-containing protein [Tepidisphaeraceae bacterium]
MEPLLEPQMEPLEPRRLLAASVIHIDVAGPGHTEASGKVWQADRGFTAGTASAAPFAVAGTSEDALYASRRYGDFSYSLPIKSGDYRVRLLLVDPINSSAGQRTFDVFSEKRLALNDFDLAAAANLTGGGQTAVTKTFTTAVRDGRLNLWFNGVVGDAIVSAIEVTPLVPSITWKQVANAPQNKFEAMGKTIDGKLYVMGGYFSNSIETTAQVAVYDPAVDQWTTRGDMPEKLTHSGTAGDFGYIYLAGGYVGDWLGRATPVTRHVWRYDTASDTWTSMLPLPVGRSAGGLVRVGRKLHFFGGLDVHKRDRAEHYVLDLRKPTKWVEAAALPNPRNHLGSAEVGGKIYAIGGQHDLNEHTGNETAVHAYDVVTGAWSAVASLPRPISHQHNATFVLSGKVLSVGGSSNESHAQQDVLEYDPATNKWRTRGQLPVPLSATVADLLNGHLIVTGGSSQGSQPIPRTWINV